MRKYWIILFILVFLPLSGCQTATPVEPENPDIAVDETPTVIPDTPTPEVAVELDYCISCHSDKDALIATAKVEEEVEEEESSGVG
jgi:hypothetical protein